MSTLDLQCHQVYTTGMFIAAGSAGDLDQCNPPKEMVLNPQSNDIYAVETD